MPANRAAALPPMRPGAEPVLGHLRAYRADPLGFWLSAGRTAPVCRIRLGPSLEYWVLTDPDAVQLVLQTHVKDYPRERRLMRLNRMGGPELLFNTDRWDEWLWRRRLMQPAFHRAQIAAFADVIAAEASKTAERWADGATIDLGAEMKALTMRIIGRAMFSVDIERDVEGFQRSFEATADYVFRRAGSAVPVPLWLPTPANRRAKRMVELRRGLLRAIVEERFKEREPKGDLLDLLIASQIEENGARFTPEQLIGEMSGIVFAGHETTAQTLTWLFYLVSQNPEVEARLRAEIADGLGDRPPAPADLERMPFTEQVILETLRLYPPVYVTLREADAPHHVAGYDAPAGTRFAVNIRGLHRAPSHWGDDAERFDPDRFGPDRFGRDRGAGRHRYAYIPFLAGPKKCLGDAFAMLEMQLAVAALLRRHRLAYAGSAPAIAKPGFTLRVAGGLPMRVDSLNLPEVRRRP